MRKTAHRGASGYAPENTLAAFAIGIEQDAHWIESDVQMTKDGELVLMHDTTLCRTTDVRRRFPRRRPWRVADLTLAEIKSLDAGSWFGEEFAGEPVPTLEEMIDLVAPRGTGLILELKAPDLYPGIEQRVAATFADRPDYVESAVATGRLTVQSFDWESMAAYKALQPQVPVGLLGRPSLARLGQLTWAQQINPGYRTFDAGYVDAVHAHGMQVHTWTVNTASAMRSVLRRGVDGVITNHPDVLDDVLVDHLRVRAAA